MSAFDAVLDELCADPAVKRGKMFGHAGAKIAGKFFLMAFADDIVVKLGVPQVAELVAAGTAIPFEPMPGRAMKEWAQVPAPDEDPVVGWTALAEQAKQFVAAAQAG